MEAAAAAAAAAASSVRAKIQTRDEESERDASLRRSAARQHANDTAEIIVVAGDLERLEMQEIHNRYVTKMLARFTGITKTAERCLTTGEAWPRQGQWAWKEKPVAVHPIVTTGAGTSRETAELSEACTRARTSSDLHYPILAVIEFLLDTKFAPRDFLADTMEEVHGAASERTKLLAVVGDILMCHISHTAGATGPPLQFEDGNTGVGLVTDYDGIACMGRDLAQNIAFRMM
jgi:hypothetical protein